MIIKSVVSFIVNLRRFIANCAFFSYRMFSFIVESLVVELTKVLVEFKPDVYKFEGLSKAATTLWIISQIIYLTGIAGNVLVIFIVSFNKLLHNVTFVILASLAISDVLILIIESVIKILLYTKTMDIISIEYIILFLCLVFMLLISSFHILYVSILRYFIIVYPLRMHIMSIKKAIRISWLIYLVIPLVGSTIFATVYNTIRMEKRLVYYFLTTSCFVYYIPIFLMTGFHIAKCRTLYNSEYPRDQIELRKMSIVITMLIVISYVCPIPDIVCTTMGLLDIKISTELTIICNICFYTKHVLNPFIYCFLSFNFRQSLKACYTNVVARFK